MKHHEYNPGFDFVVEPMEFNKFTDKSILQYCLGATLYMPGTKEIVEKILARKMKGLTSMVMCFEDAISESELPLAEENVIKHLDSLAFALANGEINHDEIPLTFLRVRTLEQFKTFARQLNHDRAQVLTGFVFPKFYSDNGLDYFRLLESCNTSLGVQLYGMPILEGRSIAFKESRIDELNKLKLIFDNFKDIILNIRIGGTDFSSIFGVRRGINYSIYDILTVNDCLTDILNFFNREQDSIVISAPVWEYFLANKRSSIDHIMEQDIHRSLLTRNPIVNEAIDGLLREVILDKANGFVGKTIIHPSHLAFVNAMQAATREEYEDSCQILAAKGGVVKGSNKMNEINPHTNWARKISNRARAFGVIENETKYVKLFG